MITKKDYLNREEANTLLTIMATAQLIEGLRTLNNKSKKPIWEDWKARNFLTVEESRSIKTAHTYLIKFSKSVLDRISEKEKEIVMKKIVKFSFRLVDDYTMQKINRDITNKMQNAVVPRNQFEDWCEEIMECNCLNCKKNRKDCKLYTVFDDNFVPESQCDFNNCRYAYDKPKPKLVPNPSQRKFEKKGMVK